MTQSADDVRWELSRCWAGKGVKEDEEKLDRLLSEGWEPFAVTSSGQAGYTYHLRRAFVLSAMTSYEDYRDPELIDGLEGCADA